MLERRPLQRKVTVTGSLGQRTPEPPLSANSRLCVDVPMWPSSTDAVIGATAVPDYRHGYYCYCDDSRRVSDSQNYCVYSHRCMYQCSVHYSSSLVFTPPAVCQPPEERRAQLGYFCPQETLDSGWRHFWLSQLDGGLRALPRGDQGCCWTSHRTAPNKKRSGAECR